MVVRMGEAVRDYTECAKAEEWGAIVALATSQAYHQDVLVHDQQEQPCRAEDHGAS